MGNRLAQIAVISLLAACTAPRPLDLGTDPEIPAATWHQVDFRADTDPFLELPRLPGSPCCDNDTHPRMPAQLDVNGALGATPEARMIVSEGLDRTSPQFHMLVTHANDRLRLVARRVADRKGFDILYPRNAVHVRHGLWSVTVRDLTADIIEEFDPSRPRPVDPQTSPDPSLDKVAGLFHALVPR